MATGTHISYLCLNKDSISEPILIIGSKIYNYDKENIRERLTDFGFKNITGIDLFEGDGVDYAVDITDSESEFLKTHQGYFSTVICFEVFTNVKNPFIGAANLISFLKKGGIAILSECYVRKISKMPVDLWRFTYEGTKELFSRLTFDDSKARISIIREKNESLLPLSHPLPQINSGKHSDESSAGYLMRRIHRKYFGNGLFRLSRLIPELTIYSTAKK